MKKILVVYEYGKAKEEVGCLKKTSNGWAFEYAPKWDRSVSPELVNSHK